jgi:peptidase YpeB-like protein
MLKRILYGSGAMGVLTAGYLLGSVSLSGAFAQTAPTPAPSAQAQTAPATKEQAEPNDQAETAALASQAKITADQANTAALAQFAGGTVKKTELDSENGTVVYSVSLTDSAGKRQDVKVDATSGKVLQAQAEGADGPETPGAPEAPETPGAPETDAGGS